jgi:hypothetical protein
MDEKTRRQYNQKTPDEERVMRHAEETENGGFIEQAQQRQTGRANDPNVGQGGEPPEPVNPPHMPKGPNRSHN